MTTLSDAQPQPTVPLATKVAFLKCADSFPERPRAVEAVETHMSWVFLTESHAYKLKKPVRYEFLDFSTIEARRHDCREEVRLNRRLAPDVYLGTVPLTLDAGGGLSLGGTGPAVDWLVKMRRLQKERMLDQAIRRNLVRDNDVEAFATLLSKFYLTAPRIEITPLQYRGRFQRDVQSNLEALLEPIYGLSVPLVEAVFEAQLHFLERRPELLDKRVAQRRIVEAHGDLRPEHICIGPDPVIIDCLEFNREFRILDPVDELCFLAMECEHLRSPSVGRRVLEVYRRITRDEAGETLIAFYKCYRACLRGKLAIWHLADPDAGDPASWTATATDYLRLADSFAEDL